MASASGQFLKESPYKNIEEAFGSYLAPVGKGLQIDVGKFVTNAGAEVIEAKDDFNYSRSLLFQLAIPLYHSGVRLTYSPSDKVTLTDETMRALDDLVRSGKVRYLGFSDTPAWKVVEAQDAGPVQRLGAGDRHPDSVLAGRADGGGRPAPDGGRVRSRRDPVVAAGRRRADREIHTGERVDEDSRSRRARDVGAHRTELRNRRRAPPDRPRAWHDSIGCRARVGADAAWRDVDDPSGRGVSISSIRISPHST